MSNVRSRAWLFTINNYDDGDLPQYRPADQVYLCYQKEVAPSTGTPHLQGYVYYGNPVRMGTVKDHLGYQTAHLEKANGTPQQNRTYCSKDGGRDFVEFGTLPSQGKRTDIEDAVDTLRATKSLKTTFDQHPGAYVKYHRAFEHIRNTILLAPEPQANYALRDWQLRLLARVDAQPDPRKILFYVDEVGGMGKSWMCKFLVTNRGAFFNGITKHGHIFHAYDNQTLVVFDIVRQATDGEDHTKDLTPYAAIEALKSGVIPSGSYSSPPRIRVPDAHVIVFMNHFPDRKKLSDDRFDITVLSQHAAY